MENPFESGHIKNYLLLYASVVLIMILFFIASSYFTDIEQVKKRVFNTDIKKEVVTVNSAETNTTRKFKLIEKAY